MENMTSQSQRTFRGYYDSLPKKNAKAPKSAFVDRIAAVTMKSTKTVRGWLAGAYTPDPLSQAMIEKELGVPAVELFPKVED